MTAARQAALTQRRRALAHQCTACHRHWALRLVQRPTGNAVLCRYCGALRSIDIRPATSTSG